MQVVPWLIVPPELFKAWVDTHHIGSTTSIIDFTIESTENEFIIATEPGVIYQMKKHRPEKKSSAHQ